MSQLFLPLLYREKKTVLPDEKSCSHAAFQYAFKSADSVYRDEQKENMERNKGGGILLRQHLQHMW